MDLKRALKLLKKDVWAQISAAYISLVIFIAVFAYQLSPDKTENANQMHLSIHSQEPGFTCLLLTIPRNNSIVSNSFFNGKINANDEVPVKEISWGIDGILFKRYGNATDYYEKVSYKEFPIGIDKNEIERKYLKKKTFILGTDKFGRDFLSRLIIGSRVSISIGFIAVIISLVLGIFFGAVAGFYGGWPDKLIIGFINIIWSVPTLLMVIAITLALGKGFWQVFVAVGITMWVEVARLVRGQVKSTKEEFYIKAGEVLGFSKRRLLINHILPTTIGPLIIISAANFASAILMESGLGFLGIGAQPPTPTWGGMVKNNFNYLLLGKPYLTILPGFAIMTLVLSFMTLGNRLRDALDVKS